MKTTYPLLLCVLSLLSVSGWAVDSTPRNIALAPLSSYLFFPEFSAPARVVTLNDSRIAAETSGRIVEIGVRVGDTVYKGDRLVSLECTENRIQLEQAEASIATAEARQVLAKRQIDRAKALVESRNVSEELLNRREAELQSARADRIASVSRRRMARLNVERCQILAPHGGHIAERLAGEGERVSPGSPVVRMIDSARLEVLADVPIDQVIALSTAGEISLVTGDGTSYPLRLRRLVPMIMARGRNREARLLFHSEPALHGTTGRIVWRTQESHIPADLPVRRDGDLGLFFVEKGKALFHSLPNALEGRPTFVTLPDDTLIVIEGRQGLNDGEAVRAAR